MLREEKSMQSVITLKFQTTIPKKVRESLKLTINDTLEWKIERGKTVVIPVQKRFLDYKNAIKTVEFSLISISFMRLLIISAFYI